MSGRFLGSNAPIRSAPRTREIVLSVSTFHQVMALLNSYFSPPPVPSTPPCPSIVGTELLAMTVAVGKGFHRARSSDEPHPLFQSGVRPPATAERSAGSTERT